MIGLMKSEVSKIVADRRTDPVFIEAAVDFFRTYADRCHHGKEEDILFAQLREKHLSLDHQGIMADLIEEHAMGRETVRDLLRANDKYKNGSITALDDIGELLRDLVNFYPLHIAKEDTAFFYPCMEYFTKQELDAMLDQFWDFDRKLIHEKYSHTIAELEKGSGGRA